MKLSAEEKARRKEERVELKTKQAGARELHNFDNVALADREKELKGVRHYAPLAPLTEKRYEEILEKWHLLCFGRRPHPIFDT
jgi:hypothetical protein